MLNVLDLFSGTGELGRAFAAALEWHGIPSRTVAYCECERYPQSILLSRMLRGDLQVAPIGTDVKALNAEGLPDVDAIIGGFPCQDISVAGAGAGLEEGERSSLFFEIIRLARELGPTLIALENVPAITIRGGGGEPLQSLPRSGMTSAGQLWELTISAPPTSGPDGGAWHTPRASENGEEADSFVKRNGDRGAACFSGLTAQAKAWPSPTKADADGGHLMHSEASDTGRMPDGSKKSVTLNGIVDRFSKSWATPQTRDWKNGVQLGHAGKAPLNVQASALAWPTPRKNSANGAGTHGTGAPDLQTVVSRHVPQPQETQPGKKSPNDSPRLNPLFVEWLLGSPFGMTVLEPLATAWILSARGKRSKSSSAASGD